MDCPDGHGALGADAEGRRCGRCAGLLVPFAALGGRFEGATTGLALETRPDAAPYRRPRSCPACSATMTPWRIAKDEQWLHRCPSCDDAWVERAAQAALARLAHRSAAAAAWSGLGAPERQELVADLAAASDGERALSPFHKALTFIGVPVVLGAAGGRTPLATWAIAGALALAAFVSPDQAGYQVGSSGPLALLSAGFVHFGAWHLLGNLAFLLSFGDALEQRLPRTLLLAAFALGAVLTTAVQAFASPNGTLIAGASGGVALLIGACAVLQPGARVAFRPVLWIGVQLPILAFAALWFALQALQWLLGVQGVGFAAHLSGMALGVLLALALRRRAGARRGSGETQ